MTSLGPTNHFTEASNSSQDKLAGRLLGEVIGTTDIDFMTMSDTEQWTLIAKALRVHGFSISFSEK